MRVRGDATVAERCMLSGRSKTLRYIRKVHRVSLHFCKQIFDLDRHEYEHVPSAENTSDILAKPLPGDTHRKHCASMGLADMSKINSPSEYLASVGILFTCGDALQFSCGNALPAKLVSVPEGDAAPTVEVKYSPPTSKQSAADARRVWTHPDPPSHFTHHLLNLPAHHDCPIC